MITYEEKIPTYSIIILAIALTCVFLAIAVFAPFFGKLLQFTPMVRAIIAGILLLDILFLISFSNLKITVTDGVLKFGYGKVQKKVPLAEIETARSAEYSFRNYFGYGLRYGLDGTIGYAPRGGKGVVIKIKGERRPIFISTANPESLLAALRQKTK